MASRQDGRSARVKFDPIVMMTIQNNRKKIKNLIKLQQMTFKEIAEKFGLERNHILWINDGKYVPVDYQFPVWERDLILERLKKGEKPSKLAKEFGVTRYAIDKVNERYFYKNRNSPYIELEVEEWKANGAKPIVPSDWGIRQEDKEGMKNDNGWD